MAIGGDILIKLAADVAELRQGFEEARREAKRTGDALKGMGDLLKTVVAANVVERVVSTLTAMARSVGDIGEQAAALQLTTDQFQGIADAAVQGGLGVEGLQTAFNRLNREISNAVDGNRQSIQNFEDLGVRLIDAQGRLRDTADVAGELAGKISNLDEPNQRAGKAMEFFGRTGSAVLPVLSQLEQGADALAASLARRGGIASAETIDKLDRFFDSIESTKRVLTVQGGTTFANLLPDGDRFTRLLEAIGDAFVRLTEIPWVQKIVQGFVAITTGPLAAFAIGFIEVVNTIERLPDLWDTAVAQTRVALRQFVVFMIEAANAAAAGAARGAEAWINHWIRTVNAFVSALASGLPDWAKSMLGITGDVTVIEPIRLDFKVVGQESIDAANAALATARDELSHVRTLQSQAAAEAAENAARVGKLPPVNAPGATQPPPAAKGGGGKQARDRVAEMLDEMRRRQEAEEKALAALQAAAVGQPLKEIERAVELQKKIDETIAKIASKEKGGASAELVERITAQVTATETAAAATKQYEEALQEADAAEREFGDGQEELSERLAELSEAYATGRLSIEGYHAAIVAAREAQEEQAFALARAQGGFVAFGAGIDQAAAQFAKANDAFALGAQLFDGITNLMTQAIQEFVQEGEIQFDKLLAAFAAMLAEMAIRAAASAALNALFSAFGGGGGLGGLLFGGGGGSIFAGSGEHFATGSTNDLRPGMAYTVGEFGREIFAPRVAGQVLSADDIASAFGDQGAPVQQTVNISTGVQQTVRAEIQSMLPMIADAGAQAARMQRERGGRYKASFVR